MNKDKHFSAEIIVPLDLINILSNMDTLHETYPEIVEEICFKLNARIIFLHFDLN